MKKLIQISIVVILVLVLFQAMAGGTFAGAKNGSVWGALPQAAASTSAQSALVLTCWDGRIVSCATPNVGWNS